MDPKTLKLLRAGDRRTYDEIYYAWVPRIYRYCRLFLRDEMDAEDATAATMLLIWKNRAKFKTFKYFRNSIYLYAKHRCIDIWRKMAPSRESVDLSEVEHQIDGERFSSWAKSLAAAGILEILDNRIGKVEPMYKELLELRYKEGLKLAEMSIRLNIPLSTISDHLNKAKHMLWTILLEEGFNLPNLIIFFTLINIF